MAQARPRPRNRCENAPSKELERLPLAKNTSTPTHDRCCHVPPQPGHGYPPPGVDTLNESVASTPSPQ
ncbi:unnamed protein product [Lota lota]